MYERLGFVRVKEIQGKREINSYLNCYKYAHFLSNLSTNILLMHSCTTYE
jgi:hypothetical protein